MNSITGPRVHRTGRGLLVVIAVAAVLLLPVAAGAQPPGMAGGMPDVRQMAGIPMPMDDVPAGTVVVRVVKDELTNTLQNIEVQLEVDGRVRTARTDADGRATFPGLSIGANVHATSVVNGQKLDSQPFSVPPEHGVRLLLLAGGGGPAAATPAAPGAPPQTGSGPLSFGGQSRFQIEMNDDAVEVFYVLEIINRGATPLNQPSEVVFQLPDEATQGSTLEGSSTQVQVRGSKVSITGPFQPGTTSVQVAFTLPPAGPDRTIRQTFPIPLDQIQVLASKTGDLQISSPQFAGNGVSNNPGGAFIMGTGPALAAGTEFALNLSGLPTRPTAWRRIAIGLVVFILVVGAWATFTARPDEAVSSRRAELHARRERLLSDLVRLEQQRQPGAANDVKYAARRSELTAQLERVYGELDQGGTPASGGQGLVA